MVLPFKSSNAVSVTIDKGADSNAVSCEMTLLYLLDIQKQRCC
jgi:hypothetical protein